MLNCFLCAFIFSNVLNAIYSFPINYENNNFSVFKKIVVNRYKNVNFGEFLDINYDFGQKTQTQISDLMPYCLYDKPNNTNLSNLICGLKHKTFIYVDLPPL